MRSLLFVPGNRPDMMLKAVKTEADALIFDLEDSVPMGEKAAARMEVGKVLESQPKKALYVRINSLETALAIEDIRLLATLSLEGFVVPKINNAGDIKKVMWLLDCYKNRSAEKPLTIIPIIETAVGVLNVASIATAGQGISAIMFGAVDYLLDIGGSLEDDGVSLLFARSAVVAACRGNGYLPIDTVYPNFRDAEGLSRDAKRAKMIGFAGKACIHPSQVATINQIFSPLPDEIEWANRVLQAYEEALKLGKGSVALHGEMIDLPVVERAKRILAIV